MPDVKPDFSSPIIAPTGEVSGWALAVDPDGPFVEPELKHRFTAIFEEKLGAEFTCKVVETLFQGGDVLTDYSSKDRGNVASVLMDNLQHIARQRILSWAEGLNSLPEYERITAYFPELPGAEPPFLDEERVDALIESLWSALPDVLQLEAERKDWLATLRTAVKSAISEAIEALEYRRVVNGAAEFFPEEDSRVMFAVLSNYPSVNLAEARRRMDRYPHKDIDKIFRELERSSLVRWCGDRFNWLFGRR